jgi:prefoldin subunit 5
MSFKDEVAENLNYLDSTVDGLCSDVDNMDQALTETAQDLHNRIDELQEQLERVLNTLANHAEYHATGMLPDGSNEPGPYQDWNDANPEV